MKSFLFDALFGGAVYVAIELIWRGRSHISMFFTGGLAFALLYALFSRRNLPLWAVYAAGSAVITAMEFVAGYIVNIRLGLDVWDYSSLPHNLYGQICPRFSLAWGLLALPIRFLGDAVNRLM